MGRRRSDGTSRARNPAKLSDVTSPHATSSPSPFSTSVRSSPVAFTRSPKNDAPRPSSTSSTARPACDSGSSLGSGSGVRDRQTAPRSRRNRATGVVRIGPDFLFRVPPSAFRVAVSRPQAISPERQSPSSHSGSYSPSRAGRTSVSQAAAGSSKPSSSSSTAASPSGPSARASGATRCQRNRKRMKSAAVTGSISLRRRSSV